MKCIDSKPLCLQDKGKGKKRQRWEFCGDPNRGLLRSVLMIPSIKFYSNSPMMPTNVKIIKIRLFYISRTFLHHHANVVSYWTNSSFKHGHFLITSCFERNLATLYLTDCSNNAKEITLQTYPYLAGQRRWCRPLIHIYWNVKCAKNEAVKPPLAIELLNQRPFRFWFQLMDDHISFMSTCYPFDGKLPLCKNNNSFFKKNILV